MQWKDGSIRKKINNSLHLLQPEIRLAIIQSVKISGLNLSGPQVDDQTVQMSPQ